MMVLTLELLRKVFVLMRDLQELGSLFKEFDTTSVHVLA